MIDWYTEALVFMWRGRGWMCSYASFAGHFVDDFGTMIRVYQYYNGDGTFVID